MKSLHEIEQHWGLEDVLDANMVLDIWDDIESKATKEAKAAAEREREATKALRGMR